MAHGGILPQELIFVQILVHIVYNFGTQDVLTLQPERVAGPRPGANNVKNYGTEILSDLRYAASKEMIWRKGDTQYYPAGVTDPNCCVLKFTADDGRFYSDFYPRSFVIE